MEAPPRSFGPLTIPMRPWLLKSPGRSSQQVMRRFNKLFPWHQVLGVITHLLSMSLLLDAGSCRSKAAQLQLPSLFGSLETDVLRDTQRDRSKEETKMIRASAALPRPRHCHLSTPIAGLIAICLDYWCVSARIHANDCFEKRVETILDESICPINALSL